MLGSGSIKPLSDLAPANWIIGQVKERLKQPNSDLNELDDAELVKRARSGNNKAFEALVRRYQKLVYNVVYQMMRSHETAADLTQETFLKAYRALPSFQTDRSFKPWLLKIASNSALNYIRDHKLESSLDEMLEVNPASEPASTDDLELMVELRVSQKELADALGELPVRQREIFILRYQQDLKYEDIAEITGNSVSSVKSLLFRARENLRSLMTKESACQQSM